MQRPGFARISLILPLVVAPMFGGCASSGLGSNSQDQSNVNQYGNPARVRPAPTTAQIDERDLRIRLYQFADDSMMGRQVGRVGNKKGTDMIAAEVQRLGLVPMGNNGSYFQVLPYHVRKYTDQSRLAVDGNPLAWNQEWVAIAGQRPPRAINAVEVIFGGVNGDTAQQISAAQAAGKFVVLLPSSNSGRTTGPAFGGRGGGAAAVSPRFADAVAVATVDLDQLSSAQRAALNDPTVASISNVGGGGRGAGAGGRGGAAPVDSVALLKQQLAQLNPPASIRLTRDAAARLFKRSSIDGLKAGAKGGVVTASLDFVELPTDWGRNVIAMIPGSDPVLKHQYVAMGAHNDHVGFRGVIDKDSLKAFNNARNKLLLANGMKSLDIEAMSKIRVNMDSIRRIHPTPRLDSINNGADDDGSGSMALLEIAEAIQAMKVKPKRSTIFIWHTGEEAGLVGASFFTRNPTVPIDSVVAQLNIDMIGRGRAEDIPGGGPDYVGVVGSFFDSKDLGETVANVNKRQARPLQLDYKFDEPIDWSGYNNIYGRSDHFHYAQQGVPIAFFFTGLHGDYHQATDEAEFIDYPHYTRITNYIKELAIEVGNGPRPRLNGTKPAKPRVIVP